MGHDLFNCVALMLISLLVGLGGNKLVKVGVDNMNAGHPTLLKGGHEMFASGPLRKCIPVILKPGFHIIAPIARNSVPTIWAIIWKQ